MRPPRLAKKIEAGAQFVQTQFCFDVPAFGGYMARVRDLGLDERCFVIAGVGPLASAGTARRMRSKVPGVHIPDAVIERLAGAADEEREGRDLCVEAIRQLKEIPGVSGVHVMAWRREELIADIIAASGVGIRSRLRLIPLSVGMRPVSRYHSIHPGQGGRPLGHKGNPRYGQRQGRGRSRRNSKPVYAAVDLGSNNCRLLMARPSGQGLSVVGSFSRIVRLGEEVSESGNLSDDAMERTIEALTICAGKIHAKKVRQTRSIATQACRTATNGQAFLARVKVETGLAMETIDPLEEARLTLLGCAPLLEKRAPYALVFDVGGGSTEVMWIEQADGAPPRLLDVLSLAKGVVGLAESYGREFSTADYAEIMDSVDAGLAPFDAEYGISREISAGRVEMLGTSGTVTMLGGFFLELPRYNRALVDGLDMDFDSISAICANLAKMGHGARTAHPCIGPGRADLVVPGCAILEAVCRRWPAGSLRAADRGIREGLLLGMMAEDAVAAS